MPEDDQPRYQEIAGVVRERIVSGEYLPGALLPPERSFVDEFGVHQDTVRRALAVLRTEGLLITEARRGTFVRPPEPVHVLSSSRYASADVGTAAGERVEWEYDEVPADATVAAMLQLPEGTALLRQRLLHFRARRPWMLTWSHYPLELVAGTPIANPVVEPGEVTAQLASIGLRVTRINQRVRPDRAATAEEQQMLRLGNGSRVRSIRSTAFVGDRPVEASADVVIPADRVELEYDVLL